MELTTSIFNQRPNTEVKVFDFPYSNNEFFFNPCIFKSITKKKIYLMVRYSNKIIVNKFYNSLRLYELNNDLTVKKEITLDIQDESTGEQYEDPRVMIHDDKYYVSCANYRFDGSTKFIHQKILVFDSKFVHIDTINPVYNGNGLSTNTNILHQKNWTWFIYQDRLMCVYRMSPHTVVEFDFNGNFIQEFKTFNTISTTWKYGECRMGSNPILINDPDNNKDQFIGFFHSSIPWKNQKRQYCMGYYTFDINPPFKALSISESPSFWGNETDKRILDTSPIVIFPCGAIYKDSNLIVSFGLNDEKSGYIKL